jgi:hypothetical protein
MKLKLDDDGKAAVLDGKPVYVHDDGREVAFDAPGTVAAISRLNGEARTNHERAEMAEQRLRAFSGIDDPAAARAALSTIAGLDAKQLVDAGEIERARAEAAQAAEARYQPVVQERDALHGELVKARIGGQFRIEDSQVVAFDGAGNRIASPANPGEPASFDEALAIIVQNYPYRDSILKGTGASGSGAQGGGARGEGRHVSRAQFLALSPAGQAAVARDAAAGKASITD